MSWVNSAFEWVRSFPATAFAKNLVHDFVIGVLKTGPIPRHVAFVMDGNRRYAKMRSMETGAGHYAGFEAFIRVSVVVIANGNSRVF